jgi:hypothetical protein
LPSLHSGCLPLSQATIPEFIVPFVLKPMTGPQQKIPETHPPALEPSGDPRLTATAGTTVETAERLIPPGEKAIGVTLEKEGDQDSLNATIPVPVVKKEALTPNSPATVDSPRASQFQPPQSNSQGPAESFFSLRERVPLQLFNEETRLQKLSHWGPTLTSIASIILTVFVWLSAQKLTQQQVDLQTEQVQAELADMRTKFFSDLTSKDETARTLAELGLAGHGLKAFPVIHMTLGVEQGDIRESGVNVVYRLFQAQGTLDERSNVLSRLMNEVNSTNKTLHTGVVQSFVKLAPLLHPDERETVVQFLQVRANPRDRCSDDEGRNMLHEAVNFFGNDPGAVSQLLTVARYPQCGNGWIQTMLNLNSAGTQMSAPERADLVQKVDQIKAEVLSNLPQSVSAQSLDPPTAFGAFLKPREVDLTFDQFRTRVIEEFDKLRRSLGAQ